jgi:hypothetical protein
MVDFAALPEEERNALRLSIVHPAFRTFYRDRERMVRECIADLRAAWAAHPDDAALDGLVAELKAHSEDFVRLWALRDVKVKGRGLKRLLHPLVGPLTLEFEVLNPMQDPDQRLVIYRAADAASQEGLDGINRASAEGRRALQSL